MLHPLFLTFFTGHSATVYCFWPASAVVAQVLSALWLWLGVAYFFFWDLTSCHPPPPSLVYVIALLYHVILSSLMDGPANFMDWVGFDATVQWVQCKFLFIL
jgi:hypothetical protein